MGDWDGMGWDGMGCQDGVPVNGNRSGMCKGFSTTDSARERGPYGVQQRGEPSGAGRSTGFSTMESMLDSGGEQWGAEMYGVQHRT